MIPIFFRAACAAALVVFTFATPARANLNVFACEPEWGALVKELGGDKVTLYVATTGRQDPHQIQARPSLIAQARKADLLVCTGAELEIGWLPMVQRQAANPRIQSGSAGVFEAAKYVRMLEIPTRLDRADGDVHAAGNPHIQTDARNMLAIAPPLAQRLSELDPANAYSYRERLAGFIPRWSAALQGWQSDAAGLRDVPIAVQHKNWVYLLDWLGMREVVALEPKPGVPAGSGYLAEVLKTVARSPVRMVIRSTYEDRRPSEFLASEARVPAIELPFTVGGSDEANDLYAYYSDIVRRLLQGLK